MYLLMNKNKEVARFEIIQKDMGISYQFETKDASLLPIGFQYMDAWIENRKASKHNSHLRKIMRDCGCDKAEGFIKITHAASINDTFWIKNETEDVTWEQISFYRNKFNETVSRLAFEGLGLYGIKLSETSPELSTEGSFRKCWTRETDNNIYLYKRGSSGARNAGLEPYCEVLASELAGKILDNDTVPYNLIYFHKELASRCPLFTSEEFGYVPISRFSINYNSPDTLMRFYEKIGSEDIFRKMLVLDAITFNVDRHAGNHGVLVQNDNLQPIKMAPVFDLNLAMLPYIEKDDMRNIGNKLEEYGPRIGEDFTRIGQQALTSEIRSKLIGLKGFQFSFRGDETFEPERVQFLENLINRQIEAVLNKNILYTRDVFIPEKTVEQQGETVEHNFETIPPEIEKKASELFSLVNQTNYFNCYDLQNTDGRYEVILLQTGLSDEIHIDLDTLNYRMIVEDRELSAFEMFKQYPTLMETVHNATQKFLHGENSIRRDIVR